MSNFSDCLFLKGQEECQDFFAQAPKTLFVIGKGFDPRATRVLELIGEDCIQSAEVILIDFQDNSPKRNTDSIRYSDTNKNKIKEISKSVNVTEIRMPQYNENKTIVVYENARRSIKKQQIDGFDNIIIDTSAMPRGVAFTIIKRIFKIKEDSQKLYLSVCENSYCDDIIKPVITDESAEYLPGFNTFSMSVDADDADVIWFPVLGMYHESAFNVIAEFLDPIEICPVVPFPSANVRRGENILRNIGEALFRERSVDKRNIIYVPEKSPILVYNKLYDTICYYDKALSANKEKKYKYVFSSVSSKLIDIGVILTILQSEENYQVGIVVVKNQGHEFIQEYNRDNEDLYCLCLDDSIFGERQWQIADNMI